MSGKGALRVIGTPDTLTDDITSRARAELDVDLTFEPLDGLDLQRRIVLDPESFDVVDHWSTTAELAWAAGAVQPVDTSRIPQWRALTGPEGFGFLDLIGKGKGAAPGARLFVQENGQLGAVETGRAVMLPTVHNCDSFAYCETLRQARLAPDEPESWGWLLDPRFRGKVALSTHAPISALEAALAARAGGRLQFDDIGNLSVAEIDALVDLLASLKAQGHFRGFWHYSDEAVKLLRAKGGSVQSIWAQGFRAAQMRHRSLRYANPIEGFRGWVDGLFLSAALSPRRLDAAYAYLNWWVSGWPGAQMVKHGTYMTNPPSLRPHLSSNAWAESFGAGGARYTERFGNVAVWNAFMDEHNYLTRKWAEFLGDAAR